MSIAAQSVKKKVNPLSQSGPRQSSVPDAKNVPKLS